MEFNQTVMARRSLRAYEEGKTVEKAQIEEMIRFAQMAPSWKNSQTGRYYVVMSPEMLEKVRKDCLPEFNQKNSANAPALIITAFEKTRSGSLAPVFPAPVFPALAFLSVFFPAPVGLVLIFPV